MTAFPRDYTPIGTRVSGTVQGQPFTGTVITTAVDNTGRTPSTVSVRTDAPVTTPTGRQVNTVDVLMGSVTRPAKPTDGPPSLALPDGWKRVDYAKPPGDLCYCVRVADADCHEDLYADPSGAVEINAVSYGIDEARALRDRLNEAITVAEQLRAGAR